MTAKNSRQNLAARGMASAPTFSRPRAIGSRAGSTLSAAAEERQSIARSQRAERARAAAIAQLSAELTAAAKIARPRWDNGASPKETHAADTADHLLGLIGYAAKLGIDSGHTAGELDEILENAKVEGTVSGDALEAVRLFIEAMEAR
jgi:hypothetical protein